MRRNSSASAGRFPRRICFTRSESLNSISVKTHFMCNGWTTHYTSGFRERRAGKESSRKQDRGKMTTTEQTPYLNTRQDEPFRFLGLPSVIRATSETTGGAFGLMKHWEMPVGFASPYHTHSREDESFYVLEGELAFLCGGTWLKAGPGTFVFGP